MEKYADFMIDIETLGNKPNAAIVQLGIVGFCKDTGYISVPYSVNIQPHPESDMDADTVFWWMRQSDEAREAVFTGPRLSPQQGLEQLTKFIEDNSDPVAGYRVWSKPSTFDIVILESLYRKCNMEVPWPHWVTRCLRTLISTAQLPKDQEAVPEVAHEAGYDAEAQAKTALICFKKLDNGHA
jgi:hypothetical protein